MATRKEVKPDANFSFERGWFELKAKDQSKVRRLIMEGIKITTLNGFRLRRLGYYEHKMTEKEIIESAFQKFGVPASKVWGFAKES